MKNPEVWPVIHVAHNNLAHTLQNAEIAFSGGATGIFLISMRGKDNPLISYAKEVKAQWPDKLVGVNHLSFTAIKSLRLNLEAELDATWTDYPEINSQHVGLDAIRMGKTLETTPDHRFFASVAFKYQNPEPNPPLAALNAAQLGMIPTTSGTATGQAADLTVLQTIREKLGEKPLGIASGVSPENARDHIGLVTHILVATKISTKPDEFDPEKLKDLMTALRHP